MEEGICLAYPSLYRSVTEESQGRAQGRNTAERRVSNAECHLLASSHASLIVLSYATQDYLPGVAAPVVAWALLKQSLIKKMPYKLARGPSYGALNLN